jgi:hypothetical protein
LAEPTIAIIAVLPPAAKRLRLDIFMSARPRLRRAQEESRLTSAETWEGKRLQKFVYKGIGNVMAANQGVLWPKR